MKSSVNQWHHSGSYLAIASVCLSTSKWARQQPLQYCNAGIDADMVRYLWGEKQQIFFFPPERDLAKILRDKTLKRQNTWFYVSHRLFPNGGAIRVVNWFLFFPLVLDTGVPHSHIMRQPQQGAASVVGELTCRQRAEVTAPTTAKTWGEDSNLK